MTQVSSPLEPWRALAPSILGLRAVAYVLMAGLLVIGSIAENRIAWIAILAALLAAPLPWLRRSVESWQRVEVAVAIDIVVASLAWWRVPGDPVLPLVITLWAVAVGAFFCSPRMEKVLIGGIVTLEAVKLPLASTVFAGRFGEGSFFRDIFSSEWLVQLALLAGRLMIVLATYFLFRAISSLYRESQKRIEENEVRFRTLVESSPNSIIVVRDGSIVFVNQSTPDLFGAGRDALIGTPALGPIPNEHHSLASQLLADTQTNGSTHRLEDMLITTLDGEPRRVDLTLAPTLFEDHPAVQIVVQDVTERFEAAQRLSESEARYREFFEQLPVALYRTSPDGRILDANQELVRLLGVDDASELVDRMASSFYAAEGARSEFVHSIEADGTVVGHEVEIRPATGPTIWVRDSARVLATPDGVIYEGALIDVTERRSAEAEVRRRADQQEAVARVGHLALTGASLAEVFEVAAATMSHQLEADVTEVLCVLEDGSFALEAGMGWSESQLRGRLVQPTAASHHEYVIASDRAVLIPDLATETRFEPSQALVAAGATTGASVPIRGQEGPLGMIGGFRRTTRIFTDDDIFFLESLANIVAAAIERHRVSTRLEELVRSKDQFVAAVSHEVRTPLTVVSGLAHELSERWEEFDEAEVAELIELLVDQSREMADLIEDLLVSARADIGKVEIRPETLRLQDHVSAVLDPLPEHDARRIRATGPEASVVADPIRLRQIIRNLVTNALRYGGPEITVTVGNGGPSGYLEVRDNGAEIATKDQHRIFEPYHRAHELEGRTASVGLGLAVSRTLAEMMDGTLTYSHDGESVFRLTLPAA